MIASYSILINVVDWAIAKTIYLKTMAKAVAVCYVVVVENNNWVEMTTKKERKWLK